MSNNKVIGYCLSGFLVLLGLFLMLAFKIYSQNVIINSKADTTLVSKYFWEMRINMIEISNKQDTIISNQYKLIKNKKINAD